MNAQITLRIQNAIFYLLFLVVIGLLAWLGKTYHKTLDVTQNQQNSLHESTQILLKKLDKPLELTAYVPDKAVVHSNIKQLVEKYKKYKSDIELEFVNPDLNPTRAKQDGIKYNGQLLLALGDKSEVLSSVDEQSMINALQRLSRDKPRLAIFVEGHGEHSPLDDKSNGLSKFSGLLEKKGFRFQPHNIVNTQSIPANASFLIIAAPLKDYLESEVKIIDDYLQQGGNLLWLHEPGDLHALDDIEQQLGLEIHEGTLFDADEARQNALGIKHPAGIAVNVYGKSELTKNLLSRTLFPFATAILQDQEIKDSDWKYQPILSTMPTSWLESGAVQGDIKFDDDADKPGPLTMGMILTRDNKNSDENAHEQRVVVVGDSEFLLNGYIGQGSNLEFATNIFNWLSEDDDLLSIKASVAPGRNLELSDMGRIGLASLWIALPIILVIIGMVRWIRRGKR